MTSPANMNPDDPEVVARRKAATERVVRRIAKLKIKYYKLDVTVDEYIAECVRRTEGRNEG